MVIGGRSVQIFDFGIQNQAQISANKYKLESLVYRSSGILFPREFADFKNLKFFDWTETCMVFDIIDILKFATKLKIQDFKFRTQTLKFSDQFKKH